MMNVIKKGALAFYDSVANGETLTSTAQAAIWSHELNKDGIHVLYILTANNAYYKQEYGKSIEAIKQADFEQEWQQAPKPQTEQLALSADDVRAIVKDEIKKLFKSID